MVHPVKRWKRLLPFSMLELRVPFLGICILSNNAELHGKKFDPATGTAFQQYFLEVVKSYAERKAIK